MQRSTDFNMILAPVWHHAVYVYIPEVYSAIRKYGYFVVTTVTIYRHFFISLRRHVYKKKMPPEGFDVETRKLCAYIGKWARGRDLVLEIMDQP